MIRYLSYIACLVLATPAFAVKPVKLKNPLCPLPGQTGTCTQAAPTTPLLPATQPKFVNELPQPVFFTPDTVTHPGFDYYVVNSAPAGASLANPKFPFDLASTAPAVTAPDLFSPAIQVPKIWLGLMDPLTNTTLMTELWGYGQLDTPNQASVLGGLSTYPAMSFRATRGTPVKVKWQNDLPNYHVFCKQPLNSDVPCGIDRTLMGTRATPIPYAITQYGGNQQPDNAMVVHLHGGEIPPDSDGFAELWFGNTVTAAAYSGALPHAVGGAQNIDPPWLGTTGDIWAPNAVDTTIPNWNRNGTLAGDPNATTLGSLIRPTGNSMIYNYPMVQDAATIWYHDHALGKTRVNVAAGPAGYFYVQDPQVDVPLFGALPDQAGYAFGNCSNGGILAGACRDIPIVLQDRAFNADGSINFPNLLGQATTKQLNALTPGPNPTIHPQWVPEYFGDHAVVNGITWPKLTVGPGAYRFRFLDGSNARCYVLSLTAAAAPVAGAPAPAPLKQFTIIASDQGYLPAPVVSPTLTICPGERYEAVVDFSGLPNGTRVDLYNTAGAPFPNGITPQMPASPDLFLSSMMQFVVDTTITAPTWTVPANWTATLDAALPVGLGTRLASLTAGQPVAAGALYTQPATFYRHFVLNEVLDRATRAPLAVQIDGLPFEAPVSEIPKRGTTEVWDIVNTTVDAHPMHLHLVQFKVIGRWNMDIAAFTRAAVNGFPPVVNKAINPAAYVLGGMIAPEPGEQGLKDTARSYPGQLLRVVAHWDGAWADNVVNLPAPGAPFFQPVTSGPYVWHCHIVDHEDNEMMRPVLVLP